MQAKTSLARIEINLNAEDEYLIVFAGRLLEDGDLEAAEEQKQRIEQLQRERRRVLEENGLTHQPKFFRLPEHSTLLFRNIPPPFFLPECSPEICFSSPPQEVKRWRLGEQQHILGTEEGCWLLPHRFPHAVVTPDPLRSCTCFLNLHSLLCDPGWFWWRLPSVLTIHI